MFPSITLCFYRADIETCRHDAVRDMVHSEKTEIINGMDKKKENAKMVRKQVTIQEGQQGAIYVWETKLMHSQLQNLHLLPTYLLYLFSATDFRYLVM